MFILYTIRIYVYNNIHICDPRDFLPSGDEKCRADCTGHGNEARIPALGSYKSIQMDHELPIHDSVCQANLGQLLMHSPNFVRFLETKQVVNVT
jgi:hypothetical protein